MTDVVSRLYANPTLVSIPVYTSSSALPEGQTRQTRGEDRSGETYEQLTLSRCRALGYSAILRARRLGDKYRECSHSIPASEPLVLATFRP